MLQDIRFALRLLVKDRSFTLTAVLTLALCLGANAAIFSVVHSILLKPLPVPDSDRLMLVYNSYPNAGAERGGAGVPDYYDRMQDAPAFQEQALYREAGVTLGEPGREAERLNAIRATPSFFRLVKVQPQLGRIFREDEGEVDKNHEVILSDGLWRSHFGADRSIVGRTIHLGGGAVVEVVGVMPPDFKFLWKGIDIWMPEAFTAKQKSDDSRHSNSWSEIGLLKPGATRDQAQQQINAINARNDVRFPNFHQILHDAGFHTVVVPLQDDVTREIRPVLYLLWGGVLFVLLIGCVNIANLVLVRSSGRARELATRHAIGAGIGRLSRQLFTETTLVTLIGGALGLALGTWALRSVSMLHLDDLPRGFEIHMDPASVVVLFVVTLVVGLLVGVVPALRLARLNVNSALRDEGRSGTSGRGTRLVRTILATAQVAIASVLLVGAGLLLSSFRHVLRIDPGFEPAGVITASVNLPQATYADDPAIVSFTTRALERVRALPGVEVAGATDTIPMGGDYSDSVILAEGYQMKPGESLISPSELEVSDGYFEAMRIAIVRGRSFITGDTASSPRVAVVDEKLAQKFWPGRDAVGRRLYSPQSAKDVLAMGPDTKFILIVGVARDVQLKGLADRASVGAYYFPLSQSVSRGFSFTIRTRGNPVDLVEPLRKTVASIDPGLPLFDVHTMSERVDSSLLDRRVPMYVATGFAIVALLLSAIGIYGVLAYGVAQRRREIGIRMALGSTTREVFALVLADGARITVIGLVIGVAGALVAGRAMTAMLYDVRPGDPFVIMLVIAALGLVALVASVIPARRAMKIDPMMALSDK